MSATAAEIDDYLSRYAGTLAAFDAGAAAELWGTPGMILDDRSAGVLDSREEMARGLERVLSALPQTRPGVGRIRAAEPRTAQ
ncbi:hypothetical protein ACU686_14080 [Yinghuangia aomiensis]